MNRSEHVRTCDTMEKYRILVSIITKAENRLRFSELAFLSLNILIVFFLITVVLILTRRADYYLTYFDCALVFMCIAIGMFVDIYWVAYAMREQLKLKLRYFQGRSFERKLDCPDETIFSDENIFFDPQIRRIESADKKETLLYPVGGMTGMDGVAGALKPRHFTWLLPATFVAVYGTVFILIITKL